MITMKLTPPGIAKLCGLEAPQDGPPLKAYRDEAGVWTIGYGSTYIDGRPVRKGDYLHDESIARLLLMRTLPLYENCVDHHITADITNPQFDALVLLCFNIGPESFEHSSLVRIINENHLDYSAIEPHWLEWNKVTINGRHEISNGLVYRRKSEFELYAHGNYHYKA